MIEPRLLSATIKVLELTSTTTGQEYYRALARGVADCLGVKFGLVGNQVTRERMLVRAIWKDGEYLPGFEYDLDGTPCAQVLETGFCHFPERVAQLFPRDDMLAAMGIESYLGWRVAGRTAGVRGIVVALHDQPTAHVAAEVERVLSLLAQRAAAEYEREAQQAALVESEARQRMIIESCLEGVWVLDDKGNTTFVNTQMADMLGHSVEEMLGRHLFDFMSAEAQAQAKANLARRRSGIRERHEFRLRRKDGTEVWTIMSTAPVLDAAGAYVGAQALVTDLTERRQLEARVLQAQKLESLGVLAGGIAHDFNNLLVGILGNAGAALTTLPPESPVVPAISDIQDAATRLGDLTRQMLAYSGRGRFVIQRLSINRIIEEISHLLKSVISKKAVLRFDLASTPVDVEGDATQLRQVVMNLITNASDALGDEEGVITVSTRPFHADDDYLRSTYSDTSLVAGDYVAFEVSDTGAGMDAATRDRMFDPFFTTKFTGRGLGLSAVLGILRGHRGAVRVYSELGKGTSIKVILPRVAGAAAAATEAPSTVQPVVQSSGVVLVADDEPAVRRVAVRVLSAAGYEVLEAQDGREAVEVLDREGARITVVLLDMTMPGLSGEEVFAHARHTRPDLPVVLSSGYNEQESTSHFVGKGLAGFVQKPWTPGDLLAALRSARER